MLTLTLPYPPSANRYWAHRVVKTGGKSMALTYVTADAKAYRKDVAELCRAAGIVQPLPGRIAVTVQLYPHRPLDWATRQRKHGATWDDTVQCIDVDNANKVLLDALKGVAFDDDKFVRRLLSERMEPDAHGSRVVVTVQQMAAAGPVQMDLAA